MLVQFIIQDILALSQSNTSYSKASGHESTHLGTLNILVHYLIRNTGVSEGLTSSESVLW